jgi:8-oxo-dGTP diphosphatase
MGHIIKIGLAVLRSGRILLVRKRHSAFYILPGGKPEKGEGDLCALHREISEELGCQIDAGSVVFLGAFSDRAAGSPDVTVTVRLYGGDLVGTPTPNSEIEEICWFCPLDHRLNLAPSLHNSIVPFLFTPDCRSGPPAQSRSVAQAEVTCRAIVASAF